MDISDKSEVLVPQIVGVMEFRETTTRPTLLYFTAEQWSQTIKDVPLETETPHPKEGWALEAFPVPGGKGDMLVGHRGCPPGTIPIGSSKVELRYVPKGKSEYTPAPDTDAIELRCIEEPDSQEPATIPDCIPIILIRSGAVIGCADGSCSDCETVRTEDECGRVVIRCRCKLV